MPRMLELIRTSQVPSNLMQSAARGSLSVPPGEMIEILVYLALHHKLFGQQASLTLAGWDKMACLAAAQDPGTSAEVLKYWTSRENLRAPLLPALAENPSVPERSLQELATEGTRSTVDVLMRSPRVLGSPRLLRALCSNATLRPSELSQIADKLGALEASAGAVPSDERDTPDEVLEGALSQFLKEHAAEVEAEKDKPFRPIGEIGDEAGGENAATAEAASATPIEAKSAPRREGAAAAAPHVKKVAHPASSQKRDSTVQKIAKLDIRGRIALAMRGNKEERSILIRDGTKIVALAVLDSPKVTEAEVEGFALQKNVLEAVLRAIPFKRQFAKSYGIMRNLVFNPRTPLDSSLGLMKGLLVNDLKNLSGNKEVPEAIRKMATRFYAQKMERQK
ncbi:MAG: hypothetical protein WA172_17370 [Terriglobales bacterium]